MVVDQRVREGYKMTELGELPVEWEVKLGEELYFAVSGYAPSQIEYENDGDILYLKVSDMNIKENSKYIKRSELGFNLNQNKKTKVYPKETIIFPKRGAAIFTNKMGILAVSATFDPNIMGLICKPQLSNEFLYYYLKDYGLFNISDNSGVPQLNNKHIYPLLIPVPPINEQQKIAEILSSFDEQIENTDQLIEKAKELKKGLMQQVLTKGIGNTEFKQTELGELPVEWEVKYIEEVANTTSGGTPNRKKLEYYSNGTIPWIKTGELKRKYIFDSEEKITEEAIRNSSAKSVEANSVILAMYGATIGQTAILKVPATTNQACCVINPYKEKLLEEYLYYYLKFTVDDLINMGAGAAQPNISQQIIKKFKIAIPSLKEQQKIAEIISTVDKQIECYENEKERYTELKKGLMSQLLTGKIRVKV